MHIAYLDDSSSDKQSEIVMVGGLLIPESRFLRMEMIAGVVIEELLKSVPLAVSHEMARE